jgi:ABC-type phosphonate transport system ATPase subunit
MKQSSLPFLSLRKASFRLGDQIVFENTSWVFHRNEQWAIIGTNGSGKSLLGEALRGQLPLVHGELKYHFRTPPGLMPEEAIGHMSFEDRRLDIHEMVVQSCKSGDSLLNSINLGMLVQPSPLIICFGMIAAGWNGK